MRTFLTLIGILLLVATVSIWMKGSGSFGTIDGVRVEPTGGVRPDERVAAALVCLFLKVVGPKTKRDPVNVSLRLAHR